jgi:hypothetical protein
VDQSLSLTVELNNDEIRKEELSEEDAIGLATYPNRKVKTSWHSSNVIS